MSQENVDTLVAAIEAFNRRESDVLDQLLADDVEIVPVRAALEGTVYRGPHAGEQYCAAVDQTWEHLVWELEDTRAGVDGVLALGHIRGRGRDTGTPLDVQGGWLAQFRGGRIAKFQTYPDRAAALEAAGLRD
jgi:ketosteroid isomerase-like protein